MSDTILELRQADAVKNTANGDYVCNLAKEIIVNEGDTVLLKQAFIDSRASQQDVINITEDLNLTLVNGIYLNDWVNTGFKQNYFKNTDVNQGLPTGVPFNGKDYIVCSSTDTGNNPNLIAIQNWLYMTINDGNINGPTAITYQYIDSYGVTRQLVTSIPKSTKPNLEVVDRFYIICETHSFQKISPSDADLLKYSNLQSHGIINQSGVNNLLYAPVQFKTTITIPNGNYNANDLALYISEQLSTYNNDPINSPYQSDLIKSNFLTNINTVGDDVLFIMGDLSQCFNMDPNPDRPNFFLGASEIALSFNQTSSRFQWDYMHMPIYSDGGDICVRYLPAPGTTATNPLTMAVSKNSGIFWISLTAATVANNTPVDFWEGILGFDLTKLIPNSTSIVSDVFAKPINYLFQTIPVINSIHTTTGYVGLDSAVRKTANVTAPPAIPPFTVSTVLIVPETDVNNGLQSTISNTTSIYATNSISFLTDKFSHYILDLKMNLYNKVIGNNIYGSISGIISRYYGYGSYTYGTSDGSITYVHKGAPVIIKSIGVRILDSDKQLDQTVGPDNSIYMQIIRGSAPASA